LIGLALKAFVVFYIEPLETEMWLGPDIRD